MLLLHSGPLRPGLVVPIMILSIGHIDIFKIVCIGLEYL